MADFKLSLTKMKEFFDSQIHENWAMNMKLLRAVGLFAGSIIVMRNFGEDMFGL